MERSGTPGTTNRKTAARGSGRQPQGHVNAVARSAGCHYFWTMNLGFRCAPPQALCCRPLPRAGTRYPPLEFFSLHQSRLSAQSLLRQFARPVICGRKTTSSSSNEIRKVWSSGQLLGVRRPGGALAYPELSRPLLLECPCTIAPPGRCRPKRRQAGALQRVRRHEKEHLEKL